MEKFTAEEAAKHLGMSRTTIRRGVVKGPLRPCCIKGHGKDWRRQYFSQEELDRYQEESRKKKGSN